MPVGAHAALILIGALFILLSGTLVVRQKGGVSPLAILLFVVGAGALLAGLFFHRPGF